MKKVSLVLTMLCALLFACKPETEKPTVMTKSVEEITETTANVVAEVVADGGAEVTERGVCYDTNQNPTIEDNKTVDGNGVGTFTSSLSNLASQTTYYVRAYAINEKGISYGEEKSFMTKEIEEPEEPEIPVITTYDVTDITVNSAVCGGEIASEGEVVIIARGVCYATNQNPTIEDNHTTDDAGIGSYISNLSNLSHNTTYYVRAYATDENGTYYGEEKTFVTLEKLLPEVTTSEVTDVTLNSAVCGGEVTFDGNMEVTARGVCWSTEQNPTIEDNHTTDGSGVGFFTSNLPNLVPQYPILCKSLRHQ